MFACTSIDRFEKVNRQFSALTDAEIAQDLNFGAAFPNILRAIGINSGGPAQYAEDWGHDNFMRHTGTPLDEYGGRDHMSWFMIDSWHNYMWNHVYNNIMSPALAVKKVAEATDQDLFAAWADLFMVLGISRFTLWHGPLVYSEYGQDLTEFEFDSEKELYERLFSELDRIIEVFAEYSRLRDGRQNQLHKFDASYNSVTTTSNTHLLQWLRMMNTLRLRLAMRIVKADDAWAEKEFNKALSDTNGIILTNAQNFNTSLLGGTHPFWTMSNNWNDSRMGAGMEEVLVGYKDPRAHVWFNQVGDFTSGTALNARQLDSLRTILTPGREDGWHFKGIAGAAILSGGKDARIPYSYISRNFNTSGFLGGHRKILDAAEVRFILAEAVLRGWNVTNIAPKNSSISGMTAKEFYEDGVRLSWEENRATTINGRTVEVYLNDDTSLPIDYVDPKEPRNSYQTKMTDLRIHTIKWDEDLGREEKLEKIMIQKWINSFLHASEMWSDHRRTGYPKLHDNIKNDSNETWGRIQPGDVLMRFPMVERERLNNPAYASGKIQAKIGPQGDKITQHLWIHPNWGGPNF